MRQKVTNNKESQSKCERQLKGKTYVVLQPFIEPLFGFHSTMVCKLAAGILSC